MEHRWILPEKAEAETARRLALGLGIPPALANLLCRRGVKDPGKAEAFLGPKLKALSDPNSLPGMPEAVARIRRGLELRERITLFGDYDVDGITSLTIFTRVLRALGGNPACFLPSRVDEGYGLSREGIDRCLLETDPSLIVALDCGTSSAAEIAWLRERGVDVVVFDHHELKAAPPRCALVNPKLGDDFHYLCTAGIAFKACHALLLAEPDRPIDLRELLDVVALGTVADIVPLVEENRLLVRKGLEQMARTRWPGLRALMEVAGVHAPVRPSHVGFQLGPRLNAAGRLGTAQDALELLLTDDMARARQIATNLDAQNRERQTVEQATSRAAEKQAGEHFDPAHDSAVVVGATGWHAGVVGIVAARLARAHHRPAIVIAFDEQGVGKGSGRSIEGFSLVQALTACGGWLEKYGGHEMAAGVTIRQESFESFRNAFLDFARATLTPDLLMPRLRLDAEVEFAELDFDFLDCHEVLQPFGMGNPQPLFFARNVRPSREPAILKEKHLRFDLSQNGSERQAIWFNGAAHPLPPAPWDVAFEVERNEYRGRVNLQLQVRAIRKSIA